MWVIGRNKTEQFKRALNHSCRVKSASVEVPSHATQPIHDVQTGIEGAFECTDRSEAHRGCPGATGPYLSPPSTHQGNRQGPELGLLPAPQQAAQLVWSWEPTFLITCSLFRTGHKASTSLCFCLI